MEIVALALAIVAACLFLVDFVRSGFANLSAAGLAFFALAFASYVFATTEGLPNR